MGRSKQKTKAYERKPGRPPADGVDQRERLLDVAIRRFADRGIAATSLRGLAADAGVTPAMLNYYFGSKDRLVDATVSERLLPALSSVKAQLASQATADCETLIAIFVRGVHEMVERHPWLPGLWVREILSEGGQLRRVLTEQFASELPRPMAQRFAAAQANGELNQALDPRLLFVSLIALTMLPIAAAPVWRAVFDAKDIDSSRLLSHTLALLRQGIGP